jgi:hypothetical protein
MEELMRHVRECWRITTLAVLILSLFVGCGGKTSAQSSTNRNASPVSDFSYDLSEDGLGIKITGYTGSGGLVIIPSVIEDMPVVEIGQLAFSGQIVKRQAITSIVIPTSVVKIGMNAFSYLVNLTSITLPDDLKIISNNLFSACKSLRKVNLPANLEAIHGQAFSGCGELAELIIPESLASIKFLSQFTEEEDPNNYAFTGCGKLPIRTRQKIQGFGYTSGF